MKKLVSIILMSMIISSMLIGCGANESKVMGVYLSPAELSYSNMRPEYNYYLTTFSQQEITLLDDNTYCLLVTSSTFSAIELSENTNDAKGNERDNSITKYYGTYSSQPNELDEDLLDVTLESPTRIVLSNDQTYWLDTENWTDEMGKIVIPPAGFDESTGAPIMDENAEPWTSEQYLSGAGFVQMAIQLNQKNSSFDYTELTFEE